MAAAEDRSSDIVDLGELLARNYVEMRSDDRLLGQSFRVFFEEEFRPNIAPVDGTTVVKFNKIIPADLYSPCWSNASIEVMKFSVKKGWEFLGFGTVGAVNKRARVLPDNVCSACHSRSVSRNMMFSHLYGYGSMRFQAIDLAREIGFE